MTTRRNPGKATMAAKPAAPVALRLSLEPRDPGFHPQAWRAVVFLDGQPVDRWLTADEASGTVWCRTGGETQQGGRAGTLGPSQVIERRGVVQIVCDAEWRQAFERAWRGQTEWARRANKDA